MHSPASAAPAVRPWEDEATFHDTLYEWMSRAPWLVLSLCAHFVLALILAAVPWNVIAEPEEASFVATLPDPVEDLDEPPPEPDEPIEPEVDELEPVIEDVEIAETAEEDSDQDFESIAGEEGANDSPFESLSTNSALGLGPGGGSKVGKRFGGNKNRSGGGVPNEQIQAGLWWLRAHQDADGKWDADDFAKHDPVGDRCEGAGDPNHDVGVTALALLAFLGDGHSMSEGEHSDVVKRGMRWLMDQQDPESGLVGDRVAHGFLYDHAIATLALSEVSLIDRAPAARRRAQKAVEFISSARNPYGVWRYAAPGDGSSDTSVTGWMVFALKSAQDAGLRVDVEALSDALVWFDEVTDPVTGRTGYQERGSPSSRVLGRNMEYPTEGTEALTAVSLLCRFFLGQEPDDTEVMQKQADLLVRALPEWSDDGTTNDMYYWYYGTYAMYQMDGRHWKAWEKAMKPALLDSQRKGGAADGSWDPNGPWGYSGGRVYATATMVLSLEVYYRYTKLTGAR